MSNTPKPKIIIIAAPSGSGKTTIAQRLLKDFSKIKFSVSATTRKPRPGEVNGQDYFYLTREEFNKKIDNNDFLEWEEFYNGTKYGTLRSVVDKLLKSGYFPLLDLEVKGAGNVKTMYGSECVSIFIQPPSLAELTQRLSKRGTETEQSLKLRLERAEKEMQYAGVFDYTVVNDHLETAYKHVKEIINSFIAD